MKTSLKYSVGREETLDDKTDKMISKVVSRGFDFFVSDALSEEEHKKVINAFSDYLGKNGYLCYGFGSGSWGDAVNNHDTKNYLYLYIPVEDTEGKETIKTLYNEWKTYYRKINND